MDMFETLKAVYEKSDEKIMLADQDMKIIWKNKEDLPGRLEKSRIRRRFGEDVKLPFTESETCEYKGEFGSSCALKIQPLFDGGEVCGYLLHLFNCEDIEILSDRSGLLKYKTNFLGNIRGELSRLINMLDGYRSRSGNDADGDYLDLDRNIRYGFVLNTLSATVNYNELSKYYGGNFSRSFANISVVIERFCNDIAPLMEKKGVEFTYDIAPVVYLDMNADRLRAAAANLAANAVMYNTKQDKTCRITLKNTETGIELVVSDNGGGLKKEVFERAKRPFVSFSEYDFREFMGLTVVNLYCETFGGRLEMESREGESTDVKMVFPIPGRRLPTALCKSPFPSVPNPYDAVNSILAKAFDM